MKCYSGYSCSEGKESAVCQSYHVPLLSLVTKNLGNTSYFAGTLLIVIASMYQLTCLLPPHAMNHTMLLYRLFAGLYPSGGGAL